MLGNIVFYMNYPAKRRLILHMSSSVVIPTTRN